VILTISVFLLFGDGRVSCARGARVCASLPCAERSWLFFSGTAWLAAEEEVEIEELLYFLLTAFFAGDQASPYQPLAGCECSCCAARCSIRCAYGCVVGSVPAVLLVGSRRDFQNASRTGQGCLRSGLRVELTAVCEVDLRSLCDAVGREPQAVAAEKRPAHVCLEDKRVFLCF